MIHQQQPLPADNDDDNMCRICYETMLPSTQGLVRPCGHASFHVTCLAEWKAVCIGRLQCPCCNQYVNEYMVENGSMVAEICPWVLMLCLYFAWVALQGLIWVLGLTSRDKLFYLEWRIIQSLLAIVRGHDETVVKVPATPRIVPFMNWLTGHLFQISRLVVLAHLTDRMARAVHLWLRREITTTRFLLQMMVSAFILLLAFGDDSAKRVDQVRAART